EYVLRTGAPLLASPAVFARLVAEGEVEVVGAPSLDWLGVPLLRGASAFGVLVVQSYTEATRYTEEDRDILTFVSQHVAAALDRPRAPPRRSARARAAFPPPARARPVRHFHLPGRGLPLRHPRRRLHPRLHA